jgi:hypothetical protein
MNSNENLVRRYAHERNVSCKVVKSFYNQNMKRAASKRMKVILDWAALKHLYNKGIRARYTCINSHERLHLPADVEFIKTAVPRWTDNPMATGQKQPFSLPDEVQNTFSDNAYHILLVALGGCAGTRLALALSAFLQEMNKKNLVICSLPFKFEGRRRMIAGRAIDEMLFSANVRWFDLQVLGNDHGSRPVSEVLEMADEQFYNIFKDSGFA